MVRMKQIYALLQKHQETIRYFFFGSLTVFFNIIVFFLSDFFFDEIIANTIAFLLSVQFAYFTNTKYVFHASFTKQNFLQFWSMRIGTIFIDNGGLWMFLALGYNKFISKCVVNIIIIILNYLFSKFFIYRKEGGKF